MNENTLFGNAANVNSGDREVESVTLPLWSGTFIADPHSGI